MWGPPGDLPAIETPILSQCVSIIIKILASLQSSGLIPVVRRLHSRLSMRGPLASQPVYDARVVRDENPL